MSVHRAMLSFLLLGGLVCAAPALAAGGDDGTGAKSVPESADAESSGEAVVELSRYADINDPFFAFFIDLTESDSLGRWDTAAVLDYAERHGRPSRMPLERILQVERRTLRGADILWRRGVRSNRLIEVDLGARVNLPMPYSILGYNPGSLHVDRRMVMREWHLGSVTFEVEDDGETKRITADEITAYTLIGGWIVLDVDGWLDRILGGKLDDSWAVGFAFCRSEGEIYGLALAVNKKQRPLYGEFDFGADKVLPHGRPLASALAGFVRPWVRPVQAELVWRYEEAE